ncbi:hypothetical protein [Modicisalibacter xianhensis]|uniref:DUF3617 family protein n=1 Tax=Modicisalibacter xianhensis TaxID=442341 RepID=A0A1I2ZKT7_9GAMM|nr:hypothetical protein [Halomonas xianhensis]SFH38196.1 hypothetical protein SAMN04487959_103181 [Halomonas xianhensis]
MSRKTVLEVAAIMAMMGMAPVGWASGIPEQFLGFWEKQESCSKALTFGMPDTGLIIREASIMGYEQPCDLKTILASGETTLHATFSCHFPDGSEDIDYQFEKSTQGKLQYHTEGFDSDPLVRCES